MNATSIKLAHAIPLIAIAMAGCVLAGCTTSPSAPSPTEILYAASATLDQAEVAATAYAKSPIADKATVAQIKSLDNIAYANLHPLVDDAQAGKAVVTADRAQYAQMAVNALTSYLIMKGVK